MGINFEKSSKLSMKSYGLAFFHSDLAVKQVNVKPMSSFEQSWLYSVYIMLHTKLQGYQSTSSGEKRFKVFVIQGQGGHHVGHVTQLTQLFKFSFLIL